MALNLTRTMKFKNLVILIGVSAFTILIKPSYARQVNSRPSLKRDSVLKMMAKVADWQINDWQTAGFKKPKYNWTYGAAYTGIFELAQVSGDKKYYEFLKGIGEDLGWNTGARRFFADDYCVAQTFANLYGVYHDPRMITPFKALADSLIARPHTENLSLKNRGIMDREWAWCDALFMAPTSLAYLSSVTKEQKYLDIANKLWWKTTDFLYDPAEHLFYRDESYFERKEKNGAKVFWSRGNGWVLGGLVRVLSNMPADYPDRPKYIKLYREMIARIAKIQQVDGSWHASLLDPASYAVKETSGTGFYTYAILWGLNHKLLDKKTYWPVAEKGWQILISAVNNDGMLGFVQPVGAAPDKVDENTTETYGPGAFLLAGSELYRYLKK
jgi:unsaturated rhamnogalacturonyl hydrolase